MSSKPKRGSGRLTRRAAIATGVAGVASVAAAALATRTSKPSSGGTMAIAHSPSRMPVAFLPHGGGPWPFVELGFPKDETAALTTYLRDIPQLYKSKPKALVVISAHWEEPVPTVMSAERPPMLYDYYGFPPSAYEVTWPAPGDPALAARVRELLSAASFATAENRERGYDHGTFVPLMVTYPAADIPVVQLSLKRGLDPDEHLMMGRALAPLRDEGVFIIGSGNTFHNLQALMRGGLADRAAKFDEWVQSAATADPAVRDGELRNWAQAPFGRYAHPREEHLMPLMVIAGAAGEDRGVTTWSGFLARMNVSGFHFG